MSPDAKEARQYFYDKFREVRGYRYGYAYQKDAAVFQWACNIWPLFWVKGFIDFFLYWRDPFVVDNGWDTGIFKIKCNAILGLDIHKSEWVKRHEKRSQLQSPKEILKKIFTGVHDE